MTLFVSLKDKIATDLNDVDLGTAFRQVETWANTRTPTYVNATTMIPSFGPGWGNYGSNYTPAGYVIDPFGWVHWFGLIQRSGIAPSTTYTLVTIPKIVTPKTSHRWTANVSSAYTIASCTITVNSNGTITADINSTWVTATGVMTLEDIGPYLPTI